MLLTSYHKPRLLPIDQKYLMIAVLIKLSMSKVCQLCEKKGMMIWTRVRLRATKYNPTAKRKQNPNLQSTTLPTGEKVTACAKCIKALNKANTK
jgi:ribosomal protein L28